MGKEKKQNPHIPDNIIKDDLSFKLWVISMLMKHEGMFKLLIPLTISILVLVLGLYFR